MDMPSKKETRVALAIILAVAVFILLMRTLVYGQIDRSTDTLRYATATGMTTDPGHDLEAVFPAEAMSWLKPYRTDSQPAPAGRVTRLNTSWTITLTVAPYTQSTYQQQGVSYTISVTATPDLTAPISLRASAVPGTYSSLVPDTIRPAEEATLAITTSLATPSGEHTVAVTGTAQLVSGTNRLGLTTTVHVQLGIYAADFDLDVTPAVLTALPGETVTYRIGLVSTTPGFGFPVALGLTGAPYGTSSRIAPATIRPGIQATLFITPTGDTPPGSHVFTVSGIADTLARSANATVSVQGITFLPLVLRHWPPVPHQPVLNDISNADGDGNYTSSWTEKPTRLADSYTLQEAANAGFSVGLRRVCTTIKQSCTVSGNLAGRYYYRVRGCNQTGCSAWSAAQSTTVHPPTPTPPVPPTPTSQP